MISMVWTLTEMMVRLRGNLPNFRVFFPEKIGNNQKSQKWFIPKTFIYLSIFFHTKFPNLVIQIIKKN